LFLCRLLQVLSPCGASGRGIALPMAALAPWRLQHWLGGSAMLHSCSSTTSSKVQQVQLCSRQQKLEWCLLPARQLLDAAANPTD
jgi:hypothetical protein